MTEIRARAEAAERRLTARVARLGQRWQREIREERKRADRERSRA